MVYQIVPLLVVTFEWLYVVILLLQLFENAASHTGVQTRLDKGDNFTIIIVLIQPRIEY